MSQHSEVEENVTEEDARDIPVIDSEDEADQEEGVSFKCEALKNLGANNSSRILLSSRLSTLRFYARQYLTEVPLKAHLEKRWFNRVYYKIVDYEKQIVSYLSKNNVKLEYKTTTVHFNTLKKKFKGYRLYRKYLYGDVVDESTVILKRLLYLHSRMYKLIEIIEDHI
jgi:hypothetical protein